MDDEDVLEFMIDDVLLLSILELLFFLTFLVHYPFIYHIYGFYSNRINRKCIKWD